MSKKPDSDNDGSRRRPTRLFIAGGLVALLALLRIALPAALERALPRVAESQGLCARIGNIDLGVIGGEITLEDLVVALPSHCDSEPPGPGAPEPNRETPLLALTRLTLAFEWTDLLSSRLHITDLVLDAPTISLTQLSDGTLKLPEPPMDEGQDTPRAKSEVEPIDVDAEDPIPSADPKADAGWEFLLDRFELNAPDLSLHSERLGAEAVRLSADQLGLDALSVGADGIGLGGINLEHPELFVQREWMLSQTGTPPKTENAAVDEAAELPALQIRHLQIERAAFTVRTREGPVGVAIRLELKDASTTLGHIFPIDVGLQIGEANVDIDGQLGLNPLSFEGDIAWKDLGVPPFLLLAYPKLVPWLASCEAHGDIHVILHTVPGSGPVGLTARGTTRVTDLSFKHPRSGELALEWKNLEVDFRQAFVPLETSPDVRGHFDMSRVVLTSPRIVYTNPPDALDELLSAFGGETPDLEMDSDASSPPSDDANAPDEAGNSPIITVATFSMTDGTFSYVDRTVQPVHKSVIEHLSAQVDEIATDPAPAAKKISVDGVIRPTGSFQIRGALPGGQGKLRLILKRMNLVSYDSLAREAGWRIDSGSTSLTSNVDAHSGGYKMRNELVLHDLSVAPEDASGFSSSFGVSVDLALALLRDPSGDIPLSMPIEVGEDDVGIGLGTLALSALRDALTGALKSPIKMLGLFVPGGDAPASFGAIAFAPGESTPGPDAQDRFQSLATLLAERPMLGLALRGQWSPDDRPSLAMQILSEKALAGDDLPEIEESGFFARRRVAKALREREGGALGKLEPEDAALLELYVTAQQVPIERYRALAEARAEAARAKLVEAGAPAEALLLEAAEETDPPGVAVALQPRSGAETPAG